MDTKPIGLSGEDHWNHTCEYVTFSPQLQIQRMCLQTYPCQHHVNLNGEHKLMWGDEIYRYCVENLIPFKDNHFKNYAEWCRSHPPRHPVQNDHLNQNGPVVISGTAENLSRLLDHWNMS